jgi:hypothetical protein
MYTHTNKVYTKIPCKDIIYMSAHVYAKDVPTKIPYKYTIYMYAHVYKDSKATYIYKDPIHSDYVLIEAATSTSVYLK